MPVLPVVDENDKFTSARYGTASRLWGKRIDVSGRISNEISSANAKCQKCLEKGHWSYQCKGQRKILERSTRTKQYETDMKRMRSGLPLVPKPGSESKESTAKADKETAGESDALRMLKAHLDAEESSSGSDSDSSSGSSSSGSSSDSGSSSSSSSSSSSKGKKKAKRRKTK